MDDKFYQLAPGHMVDSWIGVFCSRNQFRRMMDEGQWVNDDDAWYAWCLWLDEHIGRDYTDNPESLASEFAEAYQGTWREVTEWAEELMEGCGYLPTSQHKDGNPLLQFVDWDQVADWLEQDYSYHHGPNGTAIMWRHAG